MTRAIKVDWDAAPTEIVKTLAAQATRLETPCGDGAMVWHRWDGPAGRPAGWDGVAGVLVIAMPIAIVGNNFCVIWDDRARVIFVERFKEQRLKGHVSREQIEAATKILRALGVPKGAVFVSSRTTASKDAFVKWAAQYLASRGAAAHPSGGRERRAAAGRRPRRSSPRGSTSASAACRTSLLASR